MWKLNLWGPVKRTMLGALLILTFGSFSFAATEKTDYIYVNGEKEIWHVKDNVIAYRLDNDLRELPAISNDIVSRTEMERLPASSVLKLEVKAGTTREQKTALLNSLKTQYAGKPLTVIKMDSPNPNISGKDIYVDDQLLLVFKAPYTSRSAITNLEKKYNIKLSHEPSNKLSPNGTYTYIFESHNNQLNGLELAAKIYEENRSLIKVASPNRINLFSPMGGGEATNDADIDQAWHVQNNGQYLSCYSGTGTLAADTKASDAWNAGYRGQSTLVGVIDFYGYDYNHPDMQGQFFPGWDCIQNKSYDSGNFYFTEPGQAHGMAVAGIIAAIGNNELGSAGVAYDTKVVPFLIDGSEASVVMALQKSIAPDFDVDVINCSFGSYAQSPAMETEINNVQTAGRTRWGVTYGVTVVASHGNDYYDDTYYPQYPSAYDNVISIAASTPDDKLKEPTDGWNTNSSWGSNYGQKLDVAAPGVCIYTTDISGADGYFNGDYVNFNKTSAAAPVASGVAVLLLSKNPQLTWQEVRAKLQEGADKVGGYNYNYSGSKPGQSKEMGYGRVNAMKMLDSTPVGIQEQGEVQPESYFNINTLVNNELRVEYHMAGGLDKVVMQVFDMTGKQMYAGNLTGSTEYVNINVADYSAGMYLTRFVGKNEEFVQTSRFVIAR